MSSYKVTGSVSGLDSSKHYTKEEIEKSGHTVERLTSLGAIEPATGKEEQVQDPRDPELQSGSPPPLSEQAEAQATPAPGRPPRKSGDAAADANPPSDDDRPGHVRKAK